jgi:hypothetical protein
MSWVLKIPSWKPAHNFCKDRQTDIHTCIHTYVRTYIHTFQKDRQTLFFQPTVQSCTIDCAWETIKRAPNFCYEKGSIPLFICIYAFPLSSQCSLSCQLGATTLHPFPILFCSYQPAPWQPHQGTSHYPSPPTALINFVLMCPSVYTLSTYGCTQAQHVQILPLLRVFCMDHPCMISAIT